MIPLVGGHPCSIRAIAPAWHSAGPGSNIMLEDATEKTVSVLNIRSKSKEFETQSIAKFLTSRDNLPRKRVH